MRILVIDDDFLGRISMVKLLANAGHECFAFEDAQVVLDKIDVNTFQVVVSDLHMPGVDGLTFLNELRKRDVNVPVVMMSSLWTHATRNEARQRDVFAILD